MKDEKIFYTIIAGFISAIFIYSFFDPGFSFSLFILLISLSFFVFYRFLSKNLEEKIKIFFISIFLLSFSVGGIRYEFKNINNLDKNLENNIGKNIIVEAIVTNEPSRRENNQIFIVDFKKLYSTPGNFVYGKAVISSDFKKEVNYGDILKISGKLEKPKNFNSILKGVDSGKGFDYVSYLGKDDIFYKMSFADISVISKGNGNKIKSFLFYLKNYFLKNINLVINDPEASLLSGILLGEKGRMSKELQDIFRISGISHIVVLSGYNITIVSEAIIKTFSFLPKIYSLSFGFLGVILFVIMSGASETAIRAGIMAILVILSGIFRKNYNAGRALLIAGIIMVFVNPKILVFDISFQLSFLATFAVIYISPILKKKLFFITEKFGLKETISSTLSAQMIILPLILYKMGIFSLVALPTNILVVPFVPLTMLLGFLVIIFGFISTIFSIPLSWMSFLLLAYIIKISEFFAGLPFSWFFVPWFSSIFMVFSYLFIFRWFIKERRKV